MLKTLWNNAELLCKLTLLLRRRELCLTCAQKAMIATIIANSIIDKMYTMSLILVVSVPARDSHGNGWNQEFYVVQCRISH